MSLGCHSERIQKIRDLCTYIKKNRGASLLLASRSKGPGIARLIETSNAESPTMMYIRHTTEHFPAT